MMPMCRGFSNYDLHYDAFLPTILTHSREIWDLTSAFWMGYWIAWSVTDNFESPKCVSIALKPESVSSREFVIYCKSVPKADKRQPKIFGMHVPAGSGCKEIGEPISENVSTSSKKIDACSMWKNRGKDCQHVLCRLQRFESLTVHNPCTFHYSRSPGRGAFLIEKKVRHPSVLPCSTLNQFSSSLSAAKGCVKEFAFS